jgi:hypothetical protein
MLKEYVFFKSNQECRQNCSFFLHASQLYYKFQRGKLVALKTTGYEKLHITVMLCITTNGKLPPYIILNRRTVPEENLCKDVIVWAQKNAWMTSELMEDWLGCVMGISSWCLVKATEYACSGCISWPSL